MGRRRAGKGVTYLSLSLSLSLFLSLSLSLSLAGKGVMVTYLAKVGEWESAVSSLPGPWPLCDPSESW